ncbi:GNAT family N-acetyltransferase [uncultured Hymenobacter sp.]|uniref:GNAT family N-acetyltransferase n=1 Tax=uncultured Hymenobacter sp. TaxID=170016 RepID=UPI0035CBF0DE
MQIELVSPETYSPLVDLLCELHRYYHPGSSLLPETMRTHLLQHLLAADSPLRLVVAREEDGRVVGLAAVSLVYSLVEAAPATRRQCQLKELYVRSSERGRGVGRQLMRWVAQYALANGCYRLDWPVNAANRRGLRFYEGLGAQLVADRLSYRLSGERLQACAEGTHS